MFIILSCSDRFFGKISFQIFALFASWRGIQTTLVTHKTSFRHKDLEIRSRPFYLHGGSIYLTCVISLCGWHAGFFLVLFFFFFISKHLTCVIFDWPLIRLSVNISGYTQDIFSTQGPVVYEAGPFIIIIGLLSSKVFFAKPKTRLTSGTHGFKCSGFGWGSRILATRALKQRTMLSRGGQAKIIFSPRFWGGTHV